MSWIVAVLVVAKSSFHILCSNDSILRTILTIDL